MNASASLIVHNEWRSRPDDERYTSLDDMHQMMLINRAHSHATVINNRNLEFYPTVDGTERNIAVNIGGEFVERIPMIDDTIRPTHWAFSQLCGLSKSPSDFLRQLPPAIVSDILNYQLRFARDIEDVGIMVRVNHGNTTINAATGPNYGRVFNSDIVSTLRQRFGDGRTGKFRIPGEFGKTVPITKENTTLYASDRDMFVFLADEENRIEIAGRRNGMRGSAARGFYIYNSEVGARSLGMGFFLFDHLCSNRIIWGVEEFKEFNIRHTKSAPDRWLLEILPILHSYAESSTKGIDEAIANAQAKKLDDVDAFLATRFGARIGPRMKLAHEASEGRPVESLWDAVTAATEYAKTIQHQDARIELEREAGKVLRLAA